VSATISIKDDEWDSVADWMWINRDSYNGLSVLPYTNHNYKQAPFETITKEEYDTLCCKLSNINLANIIEDSDETDLSGELACAGGSCEIV
jgi:ribonucleoside-diphosphate reductase alpha chain